MVSIHSKYGAPIVYCAWLIFCSNLALAHPLDFALLQAHVHDSQISFELQLTQATLAILLPPSLGQDAATVMAATVGEASVTLLDGTLCPWTDPTFTAQGEQIILRADVQCKQKLAAWSLNLPFVKRAAKTFELVVQVSGAQTAQFLVHADHTSIELRGAISYGWLTFVRMGVTHIGVAPSEWKDRSGWHFPEGIDHILFVIALVLGGGGLLELLKTVTGFTLGHSLTLALATLGWVNVSSRLVESGIALSIALVAGESLFLAHTRGRWKIAMAFGLLHGLGFASALTDLHLRGTELFQALIGFNLGVEAAQALIVIVLLPLLYVLQRQPFAQRLVLPGLRALILLIGSYWFIQRAFLS